MKVELNQDTKEWEQYRKSKFNASEVGDLFGVGFNSRLKLAHIKYGDYEVFQNSAMKRGKERENEIRAYAEFVSNEHFEPCVYVCDSDERLSASLDGINEHGTIICELKSSANEYKNVVDNKAPSEKYYLQIEQQLLCSGAKSCYFVVENPNTLECAYCIVSPNEKTQQEIIKEWNIFESEFKDKELPPLESVVENNPEFEALSNTLRALMVEKRL